MDAITWDALVADEEAVAVAAVVRDVSPRRYEGARPVADAGRIARLVAATAMWSRSVLKDRRRQGTAAVSSRAARRLTISGAEHSHVMTSVADDRYLSAVTLLHGPYWQPNVASFN